LKSEIEPQNENGDLPRGRKAKSGGSKRLCCGYFSRIWSWTM